MINWNYYECDFLLAGFGYSEPKLNGDLKMSTARKR